MSGALLLGIDIGTTNVKAVLATPEGRVVAADQYRYPTHHPRPGWAEQNASDWWEGTVHTVRNTLRAAQVRPGEVAGIAISGQGCAVTLIDAHGQVLRPAIIWQDARSEPQCDALRHQCKDLILARNGKQPAPYNADPTLMWLAQHEPDIVQAAQYSLTSTAYITYRLTHQAVMNISDASILFGFDLQTGSWSDELINCFGVPRYLYPPVVPCDQIIGQLTQEAAQQLGLEAGIPVVAGGEDTSSAGLAMGVVAPGQALLSLGTAGTLYVVQETLHVHPALLAFSHVLPGEILLGGSMVAIGGALNACREWLGFGDSSFDTMIEVAAACEPGAGNLIFLPYLSGELQPINDGNARGVFFGLSLSTSRAQIVRAVLEGTAFAIAHNIRLAAEVGTPINEIRSVGGPTKSPLWCQIIADVTGYPLAIMQHDGGAPLGNALLAASGVGLIQDLAGTAAANATIAHLYQPREAHRAHYKRLFEVYQSLYGSLAKSYAALARV